MKKNHFFIHCFTILTAAVFLLSCAVLTVYAAPDAGEGVDDGGSYVAPDTPVDGGDTSDGGSADGGVDTDEPVDDGGDSSYIDDPSDTDGGYDAGGSADEDINGADGADDYTSSYVEPEYLDELPAVEAGEVIAATSVVLPDVEVSDASLLSGIIMWLCVAVGVAVVAGVMVSKRTRSRSA